MDIETLFQKLQDIKTRRPKAVVLIAQHGTPPKDVARVVESQLWNSHLECPEDVIVLEP